VHTTPQGPAVGPRELGPFDLERVLARDYLGTQYLAARKSAPDESLRLRVIDLPDDPEFSQQLHDAAMWSLGINEPAVSSTSDIWKPSGQLVLVSPFRPGLGLERMLQLARDEGVTIVSAVALRIVVDLVEAATALAEAVRNDDNRRPYAFGGLCPQNVHIGCDGQVRLEDVGAAALCSNHPKWGHDLERMRYRCPESFDYGTPLDDRSDIFSLGVVLWELLTRETLYDGKIAGEVAAKIRGNNPPRLDRRPGRRGEPIGFALADLVDTALSPRRAARYQSYRALASALYGLEVELATRKQMSDLVRRLDPSLAGGIEAAPEPLRAATTDAPPSHDDSSLVRGSDVTGSYGRVERADPTGTYDRHTIPDASVLEQHDAPTGRPPALGLPPAEEATRVGPPPTAPPGTGTTQSPVEITLAPETDGATTERATPAQLPDGGPASGALLGKPGTIPGTPGLPKLADLTGPTAGPAKGPPPPPAALGGVPAPAAAELGAKTAVGAVSSKLPTVPSSFGRSGGADARAGTALPAMAVDGLEQETRLQPDSLPAPGPAAILGAPPDSAGPLESTLAPPRSGSGKRLPMPLVAGAAAALLLLAAVLVRVLGGDSDSSTGAAEHRAEPPAAQRADNSQVPAAEAPGEAEPAAQTAPEAPAAAKPAQQAEAPAAASEAAAKAPAPAPRRPSRPTPSRARRRPAKTGPKPSASKPATYVPDDI